jgi:hypothetical protein
MGKLTSLFVLCLILVMAVGVVNNPQIKQLISSRAADSGILLAGTVNVRDFGAKADGKTDDTPAIQRAINSISESGGTIYLPSGIYMLGTSAGGVEVYPNGSPIKSSLIINKNNVTFQGNGSSTILQLMPAKKMRAISITGTNVVIKNLVVDGNKANRNGSVSWPNGDVVDALVYAASGSKNVSIKNIEVRNGIEDGIGFWMSSDGIIDSNYCHDNGTPNAGASGITVSASTNIKVTNNRSIANTIGFWTSYGSSNITIQNNTLNSNKQEGIIIGGFLPENLPEKNSGFTITDNTINDNGINGFAGISIASAKDGVIKNNILTDSYFVAIQIQDQGTVPSKNWVVTENSCIVDTPGRQKHGGIRVLGISQNIKLDGNTCALEDLQVVATPVPVVSPTPLPIQTYPLYSLVSSEGYHLYTANVAEKDGAVAKYGYKYELIPFNVPLSKVGTLSEVYRLTGRSGARLYTASVSEKDGAIKNYGFVLDGTAFYAYTSPGVSTRQVFRLHNSKGDFLYTASEPEKDSFIQKGYILDGIAFYIP